MSCFQWFKDTNLKANHNAIIHVCRKLPVVSNGSKILIWKQITTICSNGCRIVGCFQWFKDTNLKANHNYSGGNSNLGSVVSNGSKILIWKQITTTSYHASRSRSCFQWFKDTNLKANHNKNVDILWRVRVVSNGSKILIWKQITTKQVQELTDRGLFPMVQRY